MVSAAANAGTLCGRNARISCISRCGRTWVMV